MATVKSAVEGWANRSWAGDEPVSHGRLTELLEYNSATGEFTWRVWRGGGAPKAGSLAGYMSKGYRVIVIDGRMYPAHRLAWFYVNKVCPEGDIDHKSMDATDNRIENLREATWSDNMGNTRPHRDSSSGLKGIYFDKRRGGWCASIMCNGKRCWLGSHGTADEAHAAYQRAAADLFGKFARVV